LILNSKETFGSKRCLRMTNSKTSMQQKFQKTKITAKVSLITYFNKFLKIL